MMEKPIQYEICEKYHYELSVNRLPSKIPSSGKFLSSLNNQQNSPEPHTIGSPTEDVIFDNNVQPALNDKESTTVSPSILPNPQRIKQSQCCSKSILKERAKPHPCREFLKYQWSWIKTTDPGYETQRVTQQKLRDGH